MSFSKYVNQMISTKNKIWTLDSILWSPLFRNNKNTSKIFTKTILWHGTKLLVWKWLFLYFNRCLIQRTTGSKIGDKQEIKFFNNKYKFTFIRLKGENDYYIIIYIQKYDWLHMTNWPITVLLKCFA